MRWHNEQCYGQNEKWTLVLTACCAEPVPRRSQYKGYRRDIIQSELSEII